MRPISYFNEQDFRRRGFFSYFLVALIAAIIGGLVALYIAPTVLGFNLPDTKVPEENNQVQPIIPESDYDLSPVEEIAENIGPTVVGVSNRGLVRDFFGRTRILETSTGSGVIIDDQGHIVTNYHVIEDAREVIVSLADGKKVKAEIVGSDPRTDLAVLKVDVKGLKVAPLGDSDALRAGELAVAIGNPLGIEFERSITAGVISATDRTLDMQDRQVKLIQTDAAINPGNSGGALVNKRGELIGINSNKLVIKGVEGMGFAIPINDAKPIINELIEKGYISRPYLGILGNVIDEVTAKRYDVSMGILVEQLVKDGPAHKAGIKAMDIITEINEKQIRNFEELNSMLEQLKPKDKIKVIVERYGKKLEIDVTLEEMPKQ